MLKRAVNVIPSEFTTVLMTTKNTTHSHTGTSPTNECSATAPTT